LPATHFGPRFSSTTYCFEGGWLCANNHPATAKTATIAPIRTIRENNMPSLYLFRGQFGRNAARTLTIACATSHRMGSWRKAANTAPFAAISKDAAIMSRVARPIQSSFDLGKNRAGSERQ
jgi:hypothetical protein